jgi:AmiR/NasT family two-component response regulator
VGADEIAGLREALETRTVIGQAQGLLMERYRVGPDRAFAMLVHLSQTTHAKVREVAARLVQMEAEKWHM